MVTAVHAFEPDFTKSDSRMHLCSSQISEIWNWSSGAKHITRLTLIFYVEETESAEDKERMMEKNKKNVENLESRGSTPRTCTRPAPKKSRQSRP